MVNKKKTYKFNSGHVIQCPDKANDIVNRKIFSKQNEGKQKIYMDRDSFACWIPTIDDLPSLMHSVEFFNSIKKTADTDLNKAVYNDAQTKRHLLLMKIGDIPGMRPAKQGDELGLYLDRVKQQYKPSYRRNNENLSDGLRNLRKLSHQ